MIKKFGEYINEAQVIKPGETYLIKTKSKEGAKKVAELINTKGKSVGAEAWVVDDTNVAANIPWSPGFKRSFGEDMSNFPDFISYDKWPKEEKPQSNPNDDKWNAIGEEYIKWMHKNKPGISPNAGNYFLDWLMLNYKTPEKL